MSMAKPHLLDNVSQSKKYTNSNILACLCRLGKCIGFREEALQSFALRSEIYTFAPYHELLNTARYKYSKYYPFEVPNALSTVFEERTSGKQIALTIEPTRL